MAMKFFKFPQQSPTSNEQCVAVCKICSREYKYSLNTKGNLFHHLSRSHPGAYKTHFDQRMSVSNDSNQQSLPTLVTINDGTILDLTSFHRQDSQEEEVNVQVLVNFLRVHEETKRRFFSTEKTKRTLKGHFK